MPFWKKKSEGKRVRVYDPDTGSVSSIPAAELAPSMVRITLEGKQGELWADASKFKPSGYKHPPFDEEVKDILRDMMQKLGDVHPLTLEQWEDGFRRDANAEKEIEIWAYMTHIYTQATTGKTLTLEYKKKVFEVVLSCANNPGEHVLQVVDLGPMPRQEAEAVVAAFFHHDQQAP